MPPIMTFPTIKFTVSSSSPSSTATSWTSASDIVTTTQAMSVTNSFGETYIGFYDYPIPLGATIVLGLEGLSVATLVSGYGSLLDEGSTSGVTIVTDFASSAGEIGEPFTAFAQMVVTDPLNVTIVINSCTNPMVSNMVLYGSVFV